MANGAVKDFILKQTQSGASTSTVKQRIAAQEANSLMDKINALQGNVQGIGNQYNQRYFDANGQPLPPSWRSDSSDWLKAVEPMNAAANEASALRWRLQRYESYLDADTYKKAADTLDAINSSAGSIYSQAKQENDIFSRFQNADDYNRAVELSNLYTGWDMKTEKQIEEEWNNLNHNLTLAYGADDAASIDATNKRLGDLTGYILGSERLTDTPVSAMAADYRYNRNIEQRDKLKPDLDAARQKRDEFQKRVSSQTANQPGGVQKITDEEWQANFENNKILADLEAEYTYSSNEVLAHERSPQYIEMSNINLRKQKGYDEKAASRPYTNPTKAEMDAYDAADHTTQTAPIVNDPLRVYLDSSQKDKEDAVGVVANAHENGKSSTYYEYVAMGGDKRWDLLTKDEINDYYYYLSESPEAGRQYLDRMETVLNARAMREYNKEISELPLAQRQALSVMSSIYYSVLSPLEGVKATFLYGLGGITGQNLYDKNDNKLISRTDALRANTAEEMNKSGKTFLGVPIGNLFQGVVSGADSLMMALYTLGAGIFIPETASATALKVFREAPGAALGMSAARSKMDQVYEQGGRIDQVLRSGFNAYATEWLTERFSIGMLLDDVTNATGKSFLQGLKSAAAQVGVNAAEEGAARLMETALDWLTLHRTEYTDVIRQKMAEGKSREEATKDATRQFWTDLLGDVLGGAIGGGMFAGTSVVSSVAYNSMNKAYATDIIENKMVDRTIASAQTTLAQLKEGSGQYKRLNAAIEAVQKEANVKNVQKLLRQFDLAVTSVSANAISEMAPIIGEDEAKQLKSNIKTSSENLAVAQMAADEELAKKAVEHKLKTGTGTVDLKTGNDIKIEGVYRTREKGNPTLVFKLADGSTIKYDDVSYSSNATAAMAQVISETGIRADYAMSLLNSASDEGGLDAAGVRDAILSGMIGEAVKTARHAGMSYALTDAQFKTAYEAGKMLANDKLNREIGLASQKTVPTAQTENKNGKVVGQFYDGTEGAVLRSTTKEQIRIVTMIAKAINATVEIYASSVVDGVRQFTDRRGAVHKGNAAYIPGINTIVIDINAGNALNGLVLNSLAHEVVHFIKEMAPDKFRKLADFVVGKFGEKGKSVTSLILAKQKTYKMQGYELSFMDAYEEVVADSVESMFSQKADKIVADIAEMRKVDADLAKTFVDKIKDTFKKMLSVFKKNDFQPAPDSEEGKFFAEWQEVQDELAHLFAEGAAAAADRVATAAKKSNVLTSEVQSDTVQAGQAKNMARSKYMEYFPASHKNGDTHYWCTMWAKSPLVASGQYRVVEYRGKYYEIQKHDDADFGYRIIDQLTAAQYKKRKDQYDYANEISAVDARGESISEIVGSIDSSNELVKELGFDDSSSMRNPQGNENILSMGGQAHTGRGTDTIPRIRTRGRSERHTSGSADSEVPTRQGVKEDTGNSGVSSYAKNSLRGAEMDKQYIDAVNRGDMEAAQKMVDEAAKSAGYDTKAYHGTNADFFTFDKGRVGKGTDQYGAGFYFASDKTAATHYGGRVINSALKMEKPFVISSVNLLDAEITFTDDQAYEIVKRHPMIYDSEESPLGDYFDSYWENGVQEWMVESLASQYNDLGYLDSDLFRNYPNELHEAVRDVTGHDGVVVNLQNGEKFYIAWFDNQMKSVDPVTFDDNGNVIPLSERFNEKNNDIRHSLRSVSERQTIVDMLNSLPYEVEHNEYFSEYLTKVKELDKMQAKVDALNAEWTELAFAKGKRSDETKARLAEIRKQTDALNAKITKLDRRLLDLAEFRPFRNLVKAAVKKQKAKGRDALSEYRENAKLRAKKEKLMRLFKDINTFVTRNAKDHHVPADLRKQLVDVLRAFNYGYSNNQKAKTYLLELNEAYEKIADSGNPLVSAWYDSTIEDAFENAKDIVGETNLYNMNEEQTDALYKLLKMIRTRIAKSNQLFNDNLRMTAQNAAYSSTDELKAAKTKERHEPGWKEVGEYIEQRTFDDLKPIYFFSRLGSPTMQKLFQNILEGQYVYANDIREAEEFITALNEKYNAKKWKADDKFTFTDAAGESFQLTRREVWDVYAHSRREQSRKHLIKHGIVLSDAREVDKEGAKGVLKKKTYRINDTRNHPLSEVVIGDILSDRVISKEEKAYVEELQKYLSVDLAQKGNEVSLAMYDVALYGEKNYWPIKTAKWYNEFDPQGKGNPSIATPNHSKGVAKYASSPIMINDALTTWNQHVHDMAAYHGMAIPVSDFTRVVNAKTLKEQTNVGGVRQTLEELYGPAPGRYIAQLLKDLNGNMVSGIDDTFVDMGITMSKKAAVMLSLSVAIQQPSSIMRATLYIKPKYFASRKKYDGMTVGNVMERWKQLCKIAPVAYIKEMGGYDTGLGRTATEHLRKLEDKKVRDTINDIMGFLPSFMDKITWLKIYDAAVAQVTDEAAQRNENISKSEIEKRAVALFNETIEKTQVYDSTLARSGIMRKPGAGTKALTAFSAEPTVSTNMMSDAIVRARRGEPGAKKMLAKTFGAVISAALVNALLKAIVTAPRDDDENEMLYEKYIGNVLNSFIVDAFIFTNVPVVRDIVSMLQGFSVDRMDLSVFQDIFDKWEKVFNGDLTWVEVVDALVELTSLSPVPLRNVWRDLKGANNFVLTLMKDISGENKPTWTGLGIAAKDSIPILADTSKQNALYMAYASGRQGDIQYFRSQYASATAADTAIKTALRKNDPDVREAATLRYNGNVERSAALVNKISKRTHVPIELVQEAVMSEVKKMQDNAKPTEENYDGEEDTSTSTPGTYTTTDLKLALEQGRNTAPIVEAIIADKRANGATHNQARNQVRQSAWGTYKSAYYDAYKDGNKSEMDRIKKILLGTKLWTESELKNTLSNFIKNKEEEQ